jgi:hypothetical protein
VSATIALVAPAAVSPAPAGHVYVQTNEAGGNRAVAFARASDGTLTQEQAVATGGTGITPTGFGSQASIAITADGDDVLVVNAGNDDVSLFEIEADGLHLADVTGVGDRPVSVAVRGLLVYVLNQGSNTIQALRITGADTLVRIPNSTPCLVELGRQRRRGRLQPERPHPRGDRERHPDNRHLRHRAEWARERSERAGLERGHAVRVPVRAGWSAVRVGGPRERSVVVRRGRGWDALDDHRFAHERSGRGVLARGQLGWAVRVHG